MKGRKYSLVVNGEVRVVSATNQGVVSFRPAKFQAGGMPETRWTGGRPGARANEPRTSDAAVDRFLGFLDKYYRGISAAGSDSWYAGYAYVGPSTKIAVGVHDRTEALGVERCDTVRPLAAWLLGPFANRFTVQVRGTSPSGSAVWPAVNCPA